MNKKYLLDTNIIIYALKGKYPSIRDHFLHTHPGDIFVPAVVCAEIEYGCRKSDHYEVNIAKYEAFLSAFKTLPFDKEDICAYGKIRSMLESRGQVIGGNDMLIASVAITNNLILVTNNTSEFQRIPDLRIEDWTKP